MTKDLKKPSVESLESLRPFVDALREIELDLAGIERQLSRIPGNFVGAEPLLEEQRRHAEARFEAVTGWDAATACRALHIYCVRPYIASASVRAILDSVGQFLRLLGSPIETGPLPRKEAELWAADPMRYRSVPNDDGSLRTIARFQLIDRPRRLAPDGSLAKPKRRKK